MKLTSDISSSISFCGGAGPNREEVERTVSMEAGHSNGATGGGITAQQAANLGHATAEVAGLLVAIYPNPVVKIGAAAAGVAGVVAGSYYSGVATANPNAIVFSN